MDSLQIQIFSQRIEELSKFQGIHSFNNKVGDLIKNEKKFTASEYGSLRAIVLFAL